MNSVSGEGSNLFKDGSYSYSKTSLYNIWASMRQRCLNPKSHAYKDYGGRGISICDRWMASFLNFKEDMGDRPAGKTLDRIDNDGNYSLENCRWATMKEQSNNRRKPRPADLMILFNSIIARCEGIVS